MSRPRSVVVMLACLLAAPALVGQDFYEQHLQNGKNSFAAGKPVDAATQFRIAAFGFLDRPALLTQALVHLAVTQEALGHKDDAAETIARFMQVEQRFASYAELQIEPAVSSSFESILLRVVPRASVAATPSLARLVRTEVEKVADLPIERRMAAYEAGFRKDARNIQWPLAAAREAANRQDFDEMIRWGTRALSLDRDNKDALAALVRARTAKRQCRESMTLLARFTPSDFASRSALQADRIVCLVETGKIDEADSLVANVPVALRNRPDVAAALKRISDSKRAPVVVATPSQPVKQPTATNTAAVTPQSATRPASSNPPPVTPAVANNTTPNPSSTVAAKTPAATTVKPPAATTANPAATTANPQVPATQRRALTATEVIDRSRALVRDRKFTEAVRELSTAVEADGSSRPLRLALLEAAALAKDWNTASAQLRLLSPLARGEELYMFYASMTMYETGHTEDAKPLLERARPRIVSSPLVDYYVRAILGRG